MAGSRRIELKPSACRRRALLIKASYQSILRRTAFSADIVPYSMSIPRRRIRHVLVPPHPTTPSERAASKIGNDVSSMGMKLVMAPVTASYIHLGIALPSASVLSLNTLLLPFS